MSFLFPPRAETAINPAPDILNSTHIADYIATVKYNGDAVVVVSDGHSIRVYNRHGQPYSKNKVINPEIHRCQKGRIQLLCGEYLSKGQIGEHGKCNDVFVIWDLLVVNSIYLLGSDYYHRMMDIEALFEPTKISIAPNGEIQAFEFLRWGNVANIGVAAHISPTCDLFDEFLRITPYQLYEGFVLKKRHAPLEPGFTAKNNTGWQLKVRKPTKNYAF